MLSRSLALSCFASLLFAGACSSKASPSAHDAGAVSDASGEAASCGASLGADNLSFDVGCTGSCTAQRHVTFNVGAGETGTAPCVDAMGHLQLHQLVGDDQSIFELDLEPSYAGVGTYGIGDTSDLIYQDVNAVCVAVGGEVPLLLSLPDSNDPSGKCAILVQEDCVTTSGEHAVSGTLSCQFPVTDRGANCTITNGRFSFKRCE
jgi:hypothetical protein